jgi:magnesium-protoporphyrin IX monomethyl ester (oxidative) cyclase
VSKVLLLTPRSEINSISGNLSEMLNPSTFVTFPIGLAYLTSSLISSGHNVEFIDLNINSDLDERLSKFDPDFIGINSVSSLSSHAVHKLVSICKEQSDAKIVVGGPHASAVPRMIMNNDKIDYVLIGEAEKTFSSLVSGKVPRDGICFRSDKRIEIIMKRNYTEVLDTLPYPMYSFFDMERYMSSRQQHQWSKNSRAIPIITSRGCPGNCIFCSIHASSGRSWRARSPSNVVNEIRLLVHNFGVREILFEDDNLTLDKQRMSNICDGIVSEGFDMEWSTPNGVNINTLDLDLIDKMHSSGCYHLKFGVESGSRKMQSKIGKLIDKSHVKRIKDKCDDLGILTTAFIVVGIFGEDEVTISETISFLEELDFENVSFYLPLPIPGTRLFSEYGKRELVSLNEFGDLTMCNFPDNMLELFSGASKRRRKHLFIREMNPFHWSTNLGRHSLLSHGFNLTESILPGSSVFFRRLLR